jgi:hypothetical protein
MASLANLHYDYLHFIDTKIKNNFTRGEAGYEWVAKVVEFVMSNSTPLLSDDDIKKAGMMEKGEINEDEYKRLIDPILPDGTGGRADYFVSDWKGNPIYLHINRIIDAQLHKLATNIVVRAVDELAKDKRQKENERIINQGQVREIVNSIMKTLNYPTVGKDEDPYKFIQRMQKASDENEKKAKKLFSKNETKVFDETVLQDITNAIFDNEGLALYQEYIFRTDSEVAVELGAKHYLQLNKFDVIKDTVIKNLRNFNTYMVRFYTSKTTGTPIIQPVDMANDVIKVMPFSRIDAADCPGIIHEFSVTFGNFIRMFGANLGTNELKELFDQTRGAQTGKTWATSSSSERENAMIRIARCEFESQNIEVYREGVNKNGNYVFERKNSDYIPYKNSTYKRVERHINTWYSCYYIPLNSAGNGTRIDKQYIFDYGLLQDQQRYGEDGRLGKSSYIIYQDKSIPTVTDIMLRYMPWINLIWMNFQNEIANDHPTIQQYSTEALNSMLTVLDTGRKKGSNAMQDVIRMIKQGGAALIDKYTAKGEAINNPLEELPSIRIKTAMDRLIAIGEVYNQMTMAIGINDVSEGVDAKPRVSLGATELATEASNNSRFYLNKAMLNLDIEIGYRFLYYFFEIVNSSDKERIADLESIVGETNMNALSGIKDIPYHNLGIYVDSVDTNLLKQQVMEMAIDQYKKGMLPPQDYLFLMTCENIKVGIAYLRLKLKLREKQLQDQKGQDMQMQQQMMQAQQQLQKDMIAFQASIDEKMARVDGQIEQQLLMLKEHLQTEGRKEVKNNAASHKTNEKILDAQLQRDNKVLA